MSLLAKKVAKLEWARAMVAQLENELAVDLNLAPPVRKYSTRVLGPIQMARAESELTDEPAPPRKRRNNSNHSRRALSPEKQADMLRRIEHGESNAHIARALGVGETTVYSYRKGRRPKTVLPATTTATAAPSPAGPAKIGRPRNGPLTDDLIAKMKEGPKPGEAGRAFIKRLGISRHRYFELKKSMRLPNGQKGPPLSNPHRAAILAGPNPGESRSAHARRLGITPHAYHGVLTRAKSKSAA